VDAKDVLRRYLEQRREAGETELVLDGLSVEEALRLIGVPIPTNAPPATAPVPAETRASRADFVEPGSTDWRAVLRAAEAGPGAEGTVGGAKGPVVPTSVADVRQMSIGGGRLGFDVTEPEPPITGGTTQGVLAPLQGLADLPQGIIVGSGGRQLFSGPDSPYGSLDDIVQAVASCRLCPLAREAKNPVPGIGNPNAGLVCVGEAPGATEDELGIPFVGQAGQLLTKILAAIKLAREDVYICNVLKHRPPGNRNPLPSEVEACSPYLVRQIELIRPKVIVAFGTFAAQTLLNTKEAIGKLRGKVHRYYGVPLVVTYHPAALLRNPAWKRPTWEDVQLARRLLDRATGDH
jgi:DNA polymerase